MTKRLDETIGVLTHDNLLFDTTSPLLVSGLKADAGQGVFKRGTLMGMDKTTGKTAIYEGSTGNTVIAGIVSDDVDTGTAGEVMVLVFTTGHFAENHLIIKDGYTLTTEDRKELLKQGIHLSKSA